MGTTPQTSSGSTGGLPSNIAAALAYIWFIAIIWLIVEPFNKDRFVRFHSFQALGFGVAAFIISIGLAFVPFVGWFVLIPLRLLIFVLWLICIFKAFQNEKFKIPAIGDWAEQMANQ